MLDMQIPWQCGDSDCKAQWHLASYDLDDKGNYLVSNFSDGDWESDDEIPSAKEIDEAWESYFSYVAKTGLDPLNHFNVDAKRSVKHAWQVRFGSWLGNAKYGVLCTGMRRRGKGNWIHPKDAPKELIEFLCLTETKGGNYACAEFKSIQDVQSASNITKSVVTQNAITFFCEIDEIQPVPENRIKARLRKLAKRPVS